MQESAGPLLTPATGSQPFPESFDFADAFVES